MDEQKGMNHTDLLHIQALSDIIPHMTITILCGKLCDRHFTVQDLVTLKSKSARTQTKVEVHKSGVIRPEISQQSLFDCCMFRSDSV